ncbi:hypothetical protein [Candidatus Sulfurimonas baltica]|uniref:Uncharacterized protein n=1 Tax=Candidatus Sulfurimonas baltica TaxID=2740404 RepID=A0A7S7LSW4_9BACT|nr:hypothetical protein [Candidatus Sulfurimonas baltica]QOY50956.1 hypothetical protein HUE88_07305 [Candidatus Sulfurimonas baltica]
MKSRIVIKYKFNLYGTVSKAKKNVLLLDNGNKLTKGIIDHHQPSAPKHSATMLTFLYPKLIGENIQRIELHISPDLDCVASSYLASYYIKNKSFPKFAEKLAKYLDKVDFGQSSKYKVSLSSIFSFLKNECKSDLEIVKRGHILIKECVKYGFESGSLPPKYHRYIKSIRDDYITYEADLKRASIKSIQVKRRNTSRFIQTQALIVFLPKSKLFTEWARNDSVHTKNGFDLLVTSLSSKRTIISVKPDGVTTLKGFGDVLNSMETKRRKEKGIVLKEENRVGYDIPDPWYDGRNPSHNYTIIDSPRRGSELEFTEILKALEEWSNYAGN